MNNDELSTRDPEKKDYMAALDLHEVILRDIVPTQYAWAIDLAINALCYVVNNEITPSKLTFKRDKGIDTYIQLYKDETARLKKKERNRRYYMKRKAERSRK